MCTHTDTRLDACLDSLVDHIDHLRTLDLTTEADLEQALDETRQMLGAVVMYRSLVQRCEAEEDAYPLRLAA